MNKITKVLAAVLILLFSLNGLYAGSGNGWQWSATASGDTLEEARRASYAELSKSINGVLIQSKSTVKSTDDGEKSGSSFSEETSEYTEGKLLGVEYEVLSESPGFKVRAYIDENDIPLYMSSLKKVIKDFNLLYAEKPSDIISRQSWFNTLLSLMSEYENSIHVLSILGAPEESIPKLGIEVTYHSLQLLYEGFLIENENNIKDMLKESSKDIRNKEYLSLLDDLDELRAEQTRLAAESKAAMEESELRQKARIDQAISSYVGNIESWAKATGTDGSESLKSMREQITSFDAFKNKYSSMLGKEQMAIEREARIALKSMAEMPFHTVEKSGGKPLLSALIYRKHMMDQKQAEYDAMERAMLIEIHDGMEPVLISMKEELEDAIAEMNGQKYVLSGSENISISGCWNYDGKTYEWPLELSMEVGGFALSAEVMVPYASVTGKEPVTDRFSPEYVSYDTDVEIISEMLQRGSYAIAVDYSISLNPDGTVDFVLGDAVLKVTDREVDLDTEFSQSSFSLWENLDALMDITSLAEQAENARRPEDDSDPEPAFDVPFVNGVIDLPLSPAFAFLQEKASSEEAKVVKELNRDKFRFTGYTGGSVGFTSSVLLHSADAMFGVSGSVGCLFDKMFYLGVHPGLRMTGKPEGAIIDLPIELGVFIEDIVYVSAAFSMSFPPHPVANIQLGVDWQFIDGWYVGANINLNNNMIIGGMDIEFGYSWM